MKEAYAFFLVTCLWGLSAQETYREDDDTIRLGLYFVYDSKFVEQAIFNESDNYNAYFTALTGAAEAYFKNHKHLTILLTLVNSSKLEDETKLKYVTEGPVTYLDAPKTLWELEGIFTWNENLSRDVDVVFLVTGDKMKTIVSEMTGEWYGLAPPRSICYGNASVGIIYDDGVTFNGAQLLAVQVALLLGANKDNGRWRECPRSDEYLMSSIDGGSHPMLSECSERSMWTFHGRVQGKDLCWKDTPQGALENKGSPVNFYGERRCDMCELRNSPKPGFKCSGKKPQKLLYGNCKAYCCSRGATRNKGRMCEEENPVNLPDGTPCAGGKQCIHGECV